MDGLRVVEFATGLAGPYAGQLLAAYGADVIKVERPQGGDFARMWGPVVDAHSLYFTAVNRGKHSVAVDLKTEAGRDIALRLVRHADALIENFRPGTLESWSLGPDDLLANNPDLVICRISGFGQNGPYRTLPAFDPIVQAFSGFMSVNGSPDGEPLRSPLPLADVLTGLTAAMATAAALHEPTPRQNNVIDVALLDVMLSNLFPQNLVHLGTGEPIERMGNEHPSLSPYEVFPTLDRPLCVAVANSGQWTRFCTAIGRTDLEHDEQFKTNEARLANRSSLRKTLDGTFAERSVDEWVDLLRAHEVPCARINTIGEAYAEPQVRGRQLTASVPLSRDHTVTLPTFPPQNWNAFGLNGAPAPQVGQHTDSVLEDLAMDPDEIARLRSTGVIR